MSNSPAVKYGLRRTKIIYRYPSICASAVQGAHQALVRDGTSTIRICGCAGREKRPESRKSPAVISRTEAGTLNEPWNIAARRARSDRLGQGGRRPASLVNT